jgi:small subunit ribosomal protein S19e
MSDQKYFNVKDVPAADFIRAYADHLKKTNKIAVPEWINFIKTGYGHELAPYEDDWVFVRVAAVARKIYLRGHLGVKTMSHIFGGKQRPGARPPRHVPGSRKLIRWALTQLEALKIVQKDKNGDELKTNSRIISKNGKSTLNEIATAVALTRRAAKN